MKKELRASYLNESLLPYPFCPGCGHGAVLDALNQALVELQLDPKKVVIVTDIGCQGLSDKFFSTNAFHGLHGRSITYGTGIKLFNPELHVIVLIGDGGCGIGGHHLINAARRNIGLTVLVFNNLNYGMTGGEHSATTPHGGVTNSSWFGNLERPMDICGTVQVNGASFIARTTSFDKTLPSMIADAIQNNGFSLIDIWELCTAYYVPKNKFSRKVLEDTLTSLEFKTDILHQGEHPEYSQVYRNTTAEQQGKSTSFSQPIQSKYNHQLTARLSCIIAGNAGKRIGTAANAFSLGGVLSNLYVTKRDEYPITIKTGFSLSEVILSPEETHFTGVPKPNLMVVLFPEGLKKVRWKLSNLTKKDTLYINAALPSSETCARVVRLDFSKTKMKQEFYALMAMAEVLRQTNIYPLDAYREAASIQKDFAEGNLAAIDASEKLI